VDVAHGLTLALLLLARFQPGSDGLGDQGPWDALARFETVESVPWSTRIRGASGLARDPDGQLAGVLERAPGLLWKEPGGPLQVLPLSGLPSGIDLESITYWEGSGPVAGGMNPPAGAIAALNAGRPRRWVLGTERHEARTDDLLIYVETEDGAARVTGVERVDYGASHLEVESNQGLEALCAVGPDLLLFIERTVEDERGSLTPILWFRPGVGVRSVRWLRMTTKTGRISDADCRPTPDGGAEVLAIERHYGVSRLISFVVPASEEGPIHAELQLNLARHFPLPLPNFEGLSRAADGSLWILSDNDPPSTSGLRPTLLLRVSFTD